MAIQYFYCLGKSFFLQFLKFFASGWTKRFQLIEMSAAKELEDDGDFFQLMISNDY